MAIGGMLVGKNYVTLMIDGATQTIVDSHPNYSKIREAVRVKDFDLVEKLVNVAKSVSNYMAGKITINEGQVFYGDQTLHGAVVDRILDMMREGFDYEPMVKFLENLMRNPSKRAVDELYGFLEATALPITEDGYFLAYKKVRENYMDVFSNTMDNSVGRVLEMPRNMVDEDKSRTCSAGLHFCSLSYLSQYYGGMGKVMIVKINPADVVAIPIDYNNAKGRACKYEIIGEHTSEHTEAFNKPIWSDKHWTDEEDNWDDDEGDDDNWDKDNDNWDDDEGDDDNWDKDNDNWEVNTSRPDPQATTQNNPFVKNGGLVGYNQGRKDASSGLRYNDNPSAHAVVVSDLNAYKTAYSKGWNSIKLGK